MPSQSLGQGDPNLNNVNNTVLFVDAEIDSQRRRFIRSHVTRYTRALETASGRPRKTRSKASQPPRAATATTTPSTTREPPRSTIGTTLGSAITRKRQEFPRRPLVIDAKCCLHVTDPFGSLPLVEGISRHYLADLWKYCCIVFIPSTTPLREEERFMRCRRVLLSAETRPETFYGHIAMVEMYRLSIEARNASQDSTVLPIKAKFYTLTGEANRLLQLKQERNEFADGAVAEGRCALACAYILDNDFVAARDLIAGAQRIALTYNLELGPAARAADAKAALATFGRPFFAAQRPIEPVPASIMNQIEIDSADPMNGLCTGFRDVPISGTLQAYLADIRIYCFCYQARALGNLKLSLVQAQLLAARVQQTELGLLDYAYHAYPNIVDWEALPLEPFERLVQTTALASLSRVDVYVSPSSAVGRITAKRQRSVIDINVYLWLHQSQPHRLVVETILWAILFAIQSSEPHEQRPLYLHLQHCAALLGIASWDQLEAIMYRLLYIPFLLRAEWKEIWQISQTFASDFLPAKAGSNTSTMVLRPVSPLRSQDSA